MCFACIFENVMFFYLHFADDEAMITWCFCSAETSGINECAWFSRCRVCSRFDYTLLLFLSDLWDELVCFPMKLCEQLCVERLCCWWKGYYCAEIDEMLSAVISNTTSKTSTGMFFALFSYCGVPVPSQKYQWIVFKVIENSTDIAAEALKYRNIVSDKLISWCEHVDDADNMFRVWNEFTFDGSFRNRKALIWFELSNWHCFWILKRLLWCCMRAFRCWVTRFVEH